MGKLKIFLTFPSLLPFQPKDLLHNTQNNRNIWYISTTTAGFIAQVFVRKVVGDICNAMLSA